MKTEHFKRWRNPIAPTENFARSEKFGIVLVGCNLQLSEKPVFLCKISCQRFKFVSTEEIFVIMFCSKCFIKDLKFVLVFEIGKELLMLCCLIELKEVRIFSVEKSNFKSSSEAHFGLHSFS